MVVVFKVFVVAVLALSTKKLVVGITLSAFALIFLEFAVARVFTLLNLCPGAQVRLHSLIGKLLGKRRQEKLEEESSSSSSINEGRNNVLFEITETFEESRDCSEETRENESKNVEDPMSKANPVAEEKESLTIRDVVFKKEKSKSAKLKSKIVKKIVPKKLRSYKKKKKMMKMKKGEEEDGEEIEVEIVEEEGEEESVTEVSSLFSEDRVESEISERDELSSNPPLLESCEEIVEGDEETGSKGDLTKAIVLIVIALAGLLSGKVVAIGLTLSWCLILRVVCSKSQTQTSL